MNARIGKRHMRKDRFSTHVLIAASAFALGACSSINPGHVGKFNFEGKVTDQAGKPVPNAWVKVRGWETLTDANGKWQETQVVDCGTLRDHMDSYEENDAVLVTAEKFEPSEEKFIVKHPGWFQSCTSEQTIVLDSVLKPEGSEPKATVETTKPTPPRETPAPEQSKKKVGGYSL